MLFSKRQPPLAGVAVPDADSLFGVDTLFPVPAPPSLLAAAGVAVAVPFEPTAAGVIEELDDDLESVL
ncbi:MAG: hypothetical protein ABSF27_05065 [Candidatus Dormibacteria bacterium]|jgi:hypothetical protein